EQLRTIYVGPELDAVLAHFSQVRQRKDLEAARVGQDRVRPSHEAMKSAETVHTLRGGAQHEVIGVAEDYGRTRSAHLIEIERLDRTCGANRHESWRRDIAARRGQLARPRLALGGDYVERKLSHWAAADKHRRTRRSGNAPSRRGHRRAS